MRPSRALLALPLLAASALGQNATNSSAAYVAGLLGVLQSLNLTALEGIAVSLGNTTTGGALLASLPVGNKTIFAPNDAAFAAVPSNVTQNLDELGDILMYHFVSGAFNASDFAMSPNHTIMRTFLNDTALVQLEANKSQVLVAENAGGMVMLLNQPQNTTVLSSTTYENLVIHVIDNVLSVPPAVTDLTTANVSMLLQAATASNLADPVLESHGITIFAPTDDAFAAAEAALGAAAANLTLIQIVLGNHIINGTTLYSANLLSSSNMTTASGEPLMTMSNSSGLYVMTANSTAKVVQSDILIDNGVVHLIDTVLLNTQNNPSAAESAYSSATGAAATQTQAETGAVGATGTGSSASPSGSAKSGAPALHAGAWVASIGMAAVGALAGGMFVL